MVGALLAAPTAAESYQEWRLGWRGAWAASVVRPVVGYEPNWSMEGFADHTVRQVVRVSTGGSAVRIRLSNAFGTTPLAIAGGTIAYSGEGASVRPGSLRHLTFELAQTVVVPPEGEIASDLAWLPVAPLDSLTVTLYLAPPTGPATFHLGAAATTYRATGDHRADLEARAFTETTHSWYYLAGVDVTSFLPRRGSVVTFGDSITDGGGAVDANDRYPDKLAEILAAQGKPRGVLNAGIGGNRVLDDSHCTGDRALTRFRRDALDEPSIRTVVILEGINDIGLIEESDHHCFKSNPRVTATELIAGHRELIRQAHSHGITVIGATLLPYKRAGYYTERGEKVRDELNHWIRTSGEYDAVVDLDRIMAAPSDKDLLNPIYDSGDGLHPNEAGNREMAKEIARILH
jgi:lysophospholipase L1-like esterase